LSPNLEFSSIISKEPAAGEAIGLGACTRSVLGLILGPSPSRPSYVELLRHEHTTQITIPVGCTALHCHGGTMVRATRPQMVPPLVFPTSPNWCTGSIRSKVSGLLVPNLHKWQLLASPWALLDLVGGAAELHFSSTNTGSCLPFLRHLAVW
jgi:hypothetical protein